MRENVRKVIALLLAVVMTVSTAGAVMADQSVLPDQPAAAGSTKTDGQSAARISGTVTPSAIIINEESDKAVPGADTEPGQQSGETAEDTAAAWIWSDAAFPEEMVISPEEQEMLESDAQGPARRAAARAGYPSYKEAYASMIALKDQEAYQEGTYWTNFTPYGKDSPTNETAYWFKGGSVKGARGGVGCAAFAFILSDTAFGSIPASVYDFGQFTYEDIKVGDILRLNTHFVIVLQKGAGGVIVAEGNYNKSVHWGRALSKAEAETANFIVTRYPKEVTFPEDETADDVAAEGTVEGEADGLRWKLTNGGTLTISGKGAIPDYAADRRPAWEAEGRPAVTAINIENGIMGIGDYAFYKSTALSVLIADTVTRIGNSAFRWPESGESGYAEGSSSSLTAVTIPGSVTSIGNDAFRKCSSLVSVSVSEGLETIGERAFKACERLQYTDFPKSIVTVGSGAFSGCIKMISVRFAPGTGQVNMGDDAFSGCLNLTNVTLPQTLTALSNGMFASCKILSELYIPASVSQLGGNYQDDPVNYRSPFTSCGVKTIYFGGTKDEWENMLNNPTIKATLAGAEVICDAEYKNPFAADPDDPGDLVTAPDAHKHVWGVEWAKNETHHWHDCGAEGCSIASQDEKDGYAKHSYGNWVTDRNAAAYTDGSRHRECSVCGYRQSERIPASGGSSTDSSAGSGGSYGGCWGSYGGSSGYAAPVSSGSSSVTDSTDKDNPDSAENADDSSNSASAENNAGVPDTPSGTDSSAGAVAGQPDVSENNAAGKDDAESNAASLARTIRWMKSELKQQLRLNLQQQLRTQIRTQLKKQLKKSANTASKKQLKQQLKAKLKKQLKSGVKTKAKARLKKQMQKQYRSQLEGQFATIYNEQFHSLFIEEYSTLYRKEFEAQFSKLYKKYSR